jgi:tetratricopeptide (TPR) repeat protein
VSRFSNLEFDHDSESQARFQQDESDGARYAAEAQAAFEQADFEQALRLYSKMTELNWQNVPAWSGLIRTLIEQGKCEEANRWADQALERLPREPELLAAKAVALGRQGDLDGAISFSDAAIEEHGSTAYVWLARGDVLLARREQRADYCFEKALGLAPSNWFVVWIAARIRAFYRQFSLALKLVQQALEDKPDHAVLWLFAGSCQRELGLVGAARASFQQALELQPKSAEALRALSGLSASGLGARLRGWCRRHFEK